MNLLLFILCTIPIMESSVAPDDIVNEVKLELRANLVESEMDFSITEVDLFIDGLKFDESENLLGGDISSIQDKFESNEDLELFLDLIHKKTSFGGPCQTIVYVNHKKISRNACFPQNGSYCYTRQCDDQ